MTGTRMQNAGGNDNEGGMAYGEQIARTWLDAHENGTLYYSATPLYVGGERIPRAVIVDMRSSDGSIDTELIVYNAAKGYEVNYETRALILLPIELAPRLEVSVELLVTRGVYPERPLHPRTRRLDAVEPRLELFEAHWRVAVRIDADVIAQQALPAVRQVVVIPPGVNVVVKMPRAM